MGLGLPLALLGLLALGIPLWLHRMRRRVEREQRLPTLKLLRLAEAEDNRPTTFHDLPLLIARLLVLAALAFALAQPHLWTDDPVVGGEPVAFACVLDDSLSMQRSDDGTALADLARRRARSVLSSLPAGSEAALVLAGTPARVAHGRDEDVQSVLSALDEATFAGARGTDLERAVTLARSQLSGSAISDQRVWVLTDCTESSGATAVGAGDEQVWVQCLGEDVPGDNAYIEELSLVPHPTEPGQLQVSVQVRSTLEDQRVPVEVRADGETLATAELVLQGHSGRALLDIDQRNLREAREAEVALVLDDALAADDVQPLSGALSSGPSVLLVDGAPSLQRLDDELRLIGLALDAPTPSGDQLHVIRTDSEGLADADLQRADVIILANVPAPDGRLAERLVRAVEAGAGLWIGAGDMADPFAYRSSLSALLPAEPRGSADASPPLTIAPAEPSDALPFGSVGLTRGGTSRRWLLEDGSEGAGILLRFGDGTGALVTGQHGRGRVALWTTSFDDDWTDVPLSPGFVAMVHAMVRWLAPDATARRQPVYAGSPVPLSDAANTAAFEVVLPTGERIELPADEGKAVLERTEHVGSYRVRARHNDGSRSSDRLQFQVRVDPRESELRAAAVASTGVPQAAAQASTRRGKQPIDSWIWLALGLCALLEGGLRIVRMVRLPGGRKLTRA